MRPFRSTSSGTAYPICAGRYPRRDAILKMFGLDVPPVHLADKRQPGVIARNRYQSRIDIMTERQVVRYARPKPPSSPPDARNATRRAGSGAHGNRLSQIVQGMPPAARADEQRVIARVQSSGHFSRSHSKTSFVSYTTPGRSKTKRSKRNGMVRSCLAGRLNGDSRKRNGR